jgi:DNA (cytosine-5)-methyltransferase 1
MVCRWQVEIEPYARCVLKRHWPHVKRYGDIRTLDGSELDPVDLIAGGFPCQDVSRIGAGAGIDGERSGLWSDFFRLVCRLRPRIVLVENVSGLLDGGIGRVLGDLAGIGLDAEWECVPAAAFGSPQLRERIFIMAYSGGQRSQGIMQTWTAKIAVGRSGREYAGVDTLPMLRGISMHDPYGACPRLRMPTDRGMVERPLYGQGWWASGPPIYRVASGIRRRVDRIRSLGNSVVPQVAEWIGARILEMDRQLCQ